MESIDGTWIITTEVQLEFDWGPQWHDPMLARVVSIADENWLIRQLDGVPAVPGEPRGLAWDKRVLRYEPLPVYGLGDDIGLVYRYVERYLSRARIGPGYDSDVIAQALLDHVRVPEFGSPPHAWTKLGAILAGGGVGAAGYINGVGPEPSVGLLLAVGGATLFVHIVLPAAKAFGRGLEYRIDQLMGTPPRPDEE